MSKKNAITALKGLAMDDSLVFRGITITRGRIPFNGKMGYQVEEYWTPSATEAVNLAAERAAYDAQHA